MCLLPLRCWWLVCLVLMGWGQTVAEKNNNHRLDIDDGDGFTLSPGEGEGGSAGQLAAIMDRLTSLDRSMAELKGQMAQLLKESAGAGPHKVLQDLQGVCEELKASGAAGPRPTAAPDGQGETSTAVNPPRKSSKCPPHPDTDQLVLTAVINEEKETSYIVTVCYVSPVKPEVAMQLQSNSPSQVLEDTEMGVVTVERQKNDTEETTYLSLGFYISETTYYAYVTLGLFENSSGEIPLPDMYMTVAPQNNNNVMSGNKIRYEPGSDVNLNFNVIDDVEAEDKNVRAHKFDRIFVDLMSRTEPNLVNRYGLHPDMELPEELSDIDYTVSHHSATNKTIQLGFPYSPQRESGVISFQMVKHMACRERCLVSFQMAAQSMAFYPQGRSGPFPPNFVGFLQEQYPGGVLEDGNSVKCYEDGMVKNCFLGCLVTGDDPTITLNRADPTPISGYTETNFDKSEYFASAYMEITDPVSSDAGEYVCEAKSRDGRHVITRTLTVTVDRVASIVRSLTHVDTSKNGTLVAVCVAEGRPLPNVTFTAYNEGESNPAIDQADVTVTQLNATMSQITLHLDDWKQYERNDIDNIYCKTQTRNVEHYWDQEHMTVNEYK